MRSLQCRYAQRQRVPRTRGVPSRCRGLLRTGETAVEGGDLSVELQVKRALINMLELDFARDAARFSATYDEAVFVNPHPVAWFRESCHMTSHAAATAICVGEQAGRLTRSGEAVADGRLGFAHLGLMSATARGLDESGAGARFNESRLIAKAELMSVKRFRTLCPPPPRG